VLDTFAEERRRVSAGLVKTSLATTCATDLGEQESTIAPPHLAAGARR